MLPELSVSIVLALIGTGLLAGLSNAIAGGGTLFTFPALIAAGLPPVVANASNAVAVWPGHAIAVIGYRRELSQFPRALVGSIVVALVGGIVGAILLAKVGNQAFSKLIPFLILFATILFSLAPTIASWVVNRTSRADLTRLNPITRVVEFIFAVYGGFFGAGLGVMLMAGLAIVGIRDMQTNNALKNLLATVVSTVSVVVLSVSGMVSWPHSLCALLGVFAGGLLGVSIARILPSHWLRRIVIAVGVVLSIYYFGKYYDLGD